MKTRLFLISFCLTTTLGAFGDVRYTTKTGVTQGAVTTTTWVKGKRQRTETVTDMGSFKSKNVTLTMCDQRQTVTLDPDLKIYYITPMGAGSDKQSDKGAAGSGTITNTYTVKDLGMEKVAKLNAHHWMVTTNSKATGCAGNSDTTSKIEVWTTNIQVLNCPEAASSGYNQPNCKIKFEEKGNVKGMRAAYNGMPVKMITYQGEQQSSVMEFVDYSTDSLPDSLFNLPSDYKKVSSSEFQTQIQQKMMQQFKIPNQ